jgi:hypothetical protein
MTRLHHYLFTAILMTTLAHTDLASARSWDPVQIDVNVSSLLESDASLQWTPLHWAARRGDVSTIRSLAASGQLEAGDMQGRTPLHIAAIAGHVAAVEALLDAGADANAEDRWGNSVLERLTLIEEVQRWDRSAIKALLGMPAPTPEPVVEDVPEAVAPLK